jgi:hypothetical protein
MFPLVTHCTKFEATRALLAKPDEVESPLSGDSLRTFVGAISGTGTDLTSENTRDLWFLSDDLLKISLVKTLFVMISKWLFYTHPFSNLTKSAVEGLSER